MRTFDEHWEEIEEGIRWGRIKKAARSFKVAGNEEINELW